MRVTVSQPELKRALNELKRVIPNKSATLPILRSVRFQTREGRFLADATDLDTFLRLPIPGEVERDGAITAPVVPLLKLVRKFAKDNVITLSTSDSDGSKIRVESGTFSADLNGLPANEFPQFPEVEGDPININGTDLAEAFDKVARCVSTEETRPVLSGVFVEGLYLDGWLSLIATNGHRLAHWAIPSTETGLKVEAIIPPDAFKTAIRVFGKDAEVALLVDESHAVFSVDGTEVFARLIEGPFPNYRQVIPLDFSASVEVDRKALLAAVERANVIASDQTHRIRVEVNGGLKLSVATPDLGEATEEVEAETSGEILIGFNAKYLSEILKDLEADRISWRFQTPEHPCEIKGLGADGLSAANGFHILMPLRLVE